jgi:hypothetical protein
MWGALSSWWALHHSDGRSDHANKVDDDDDDNKDDDSLWTYARQNYNATITTTVTIRVTPRDNFLTSWGILAGLLLAAIVLAAWQVYTERQIGQRRGSVNDLDRIVESSSTAEWTRCVVCFMFRPSCGGWHGLAWLGLA